MPYIVFKQVLIQNKEEKRAVISFNHKFFTGQTQIMVLKLFNVAQKVK